MIHTFQTHLQQRPTVKYMNHAKNDGSQKGGKFHFPFFWRPRNEYDYGPLGAWEMQRSNKNTSLADYREQKN
jgi:hypothetical protein